MARFKSGSRYTNGQFTLDINNEKFLILRSNINIPESGQDNFVTVEGKHIKRPDLLSQESYGRPDLWWVIIDINGIRQPLLELTVGQELRVPPLRLVLDAIENLNLEL